MYSRFRVPTSAAQSDRYVLLQSMYACPTRIQMHETLMCHQLTFACSSRAKLRAVLSKERKIALGDIFKQVRMSSCKHRHCGISKGILASDDRVGFRSIFRNHTNKPESPFLNVSFRTPHCLCIFEMVAGEFNIECHEIANKPLNMLPN